MTEKYEHFELTVDVAEKGIVSTKRMQVAVVCHTDQVLRFTVTGGQKVLEMEKRLTEKTKLRQWKLTGKNFDMQVSEKTAYFIKEIQDKIDEYLKGPGVPSTDWRMI